MCRGELTALITQLMSKCRWGGWKWKRGVKEIPFPYPCCPVCRECSLKKIQIEKKSKVSDSNTRFFIWNSRFFVWNKNMWQSYSIHTLISITYLITSLLKKDSAKNDQKCRLCSSQETVIPLLVSIFFNETLYLHSQIVALPKICQKFFLT